jgi:hypothetical protein
MSIGADYSTFKPDGTIGLDLSFRAISGARAKAEKVARRWTTPRKRMFWAKGVGCDIRTLVNADLTTRDRIQWEIALANEARRVAGVRRCKVTISHDPLTENLLIVGELVTVDGAIALLMTPAEAANATRVFFREAA